MFREGQAIFFLAILSFFADLRICFVKELLHSFDGYQMKRHNLITAKQFMSFKAFLTNCLYKILEHEKRLKRNIMCKAVFIFDEIVFYCVLLSYTPPSSRPGVKKGSIKACFTK